MASTNDAHAATFHQLGMVVFQPTSETNANPPLAIWGERVYESKPTLPDQGLKNFLTRSNAYFQKTQEGACEAREFESRHDGCMFTRLNKFLKDLHVDCLVDPPGIWLLEILGRWFPADTSSRSGLDWIEAVFLDSYI